MSYLYSLVLKIVGNENYFYFIKVVEIENYWFLNLLLLPWNRNTSIPFFLIYPLFCPLWYAMEALTPLRHLQGRHETRIFLFLLFLLCSRIFILLSQLIIFINNKLIKIIIFNLTNIFSLVQIKFSKFSDAFHYYYYIHVYKVESLFLYIFFTFDIRITLLILRIVQLEKISFSTPWNYIYIRGYWKSE